MEVLPCPGDVCICGARDVIVSLAILSIPAFKRYRYNSFARRWYAKHMGPARWKENTQFGFCAQTLGNLSAVKSTSQFESFRIDAPNQAYDNLRMCYPLISIINRFFILRAT